MAKPNQEGDYFVPILAPYVQWVQAYKELICGLYEEYRTVKRTWKAFRDSVPGVEQRLEFPVFEQILLFSLFLSECNASEVGGGRDFRGSPADSRLDTVSQDLRKASDERDRALWNLSKVQNEFDALSANLNMVVHELDNQRAENACLRQNNAVLRDKEASLEEEIKRLSEHSRQRQGIVAVNRADIDKGPAQTAIWVRQETDPRVGRKVTQPPGGEPPQKKVAGWSVQRSKDGYYRVYRKIRGKVHSIYIGRELDIEKANTRIAEKEKEL
jgi:hypothetical protein